MLQLDQHYVAGEELTSWSIELLVDDDFTGWNANSVLVGLRPAMLTNDHLGYIDANRRLKSVQQSQNYC